MNAGEVRKVLVSVSKFIAVAVLAVVAAIFSLVLFNTFDVRSCDENHPAAKRIRSLSQGQLGDLYHTVMDLRNQYPYDTMLLRNSDPPIPSELEYLKAMRVWTFGPTGDVDITLAKCNVSIGIDLIFSADEPKIVLKWHVFDDKNPYATDSEVLWSAG